MTTTAEDFRIPPALLPADGRFGSGPSRVLDEQVAAFVAASRTLLGTSHRQRPVRALVGAVRAGVAELLGAPDGYEVVLGNGGSTAFWDAAAFSLVERRSAHGVWGEFGGKFAAAATAPWLDSPSVREAPVGSRADMTRPFEDVDVVAWPHNETSTGVVAPVLRAPGEGVLTVVDATSAAGGVAFDAAEADVYYFAPQKNFGSDGGLWLALCSPAAVERIERIAAGDRYVPEFLSLGAALTNSRLDQTLNTPALGTLVLLEASLAAMLASGGLAAAAARTATSSALLYDWAERAGFARPFVARPEDRSPVVVTVDFDGVDAGVLARVLRANGVVDVEPYRKLGRNQLRVGTFASVDPADVSALIGCIEHVVAALA